jgi:predicted enzyme related to lactoylglutathione lyase
VGWAPVDPDDDPTWIFARVAEPKTAKNRVHLDLMAPDLEVEIVRLVELGAARLADREEYGYTWTVMADPEGNEFCVANAR